MLHQLCVLALAGALGAPYALVSAVQEESIEATWARLARELDTLLPGAPAVAATWTSARELRERGNTPPAELEAVSRTRVTRALGSELAVFTSEVELAAAAGFATRDALATAALETLARAPVPSPDRQTPGLWARVEVLQRTLEAPPSLLAPFVERLVHRALEAGEDPLVEGIARTPGLAAAVAPAFERWYVERVFTGQEVHRGVLHAARSAVTYPEALPRALVTDGRLVEAVRSALAKGPGEVELTELALEHADALALSHAERLALARGSLARVTVESPDLAARLARYQALAGALASDPACLRATFLAAVRARDWDAVFPRLEAAQRADALTAADAPVVAAVHAEVARREAELQEYERLELEGTWSVALFADGHRQTALQSVELYRRREGAVDFLRCTLWGQAGALGTAFSTLYYPRKKALALKFERNLWLNSSTPVMQLSGTIRLFEPNGRAFEWTLDSPPGAPKLSMIWSR
jgi:hypothetical protein